MALRLSLGVGLSISRTGNIIITATSAPTMGALSDSDTPADGYVAGTYASTEGTISSAVPTYYRVESPTDVIVASNYDLQPGDAVHARVLVTDSVGNTRTFQTNTSTVPGGAAWILAAGSWNDSGVWDDANTWRDA